MLDIPYAHSHWWENLTTQRRAVRLVKFRNIGIETTKGIGCIYVLGYTDCMGAYNVYNAYHVYNAYNEG